MEKTLDESQEFTYTRLSAAISWVCFSGKIKAKPAGSRVVTALQGKIMVQKQPCGPSPPTLGCPALQSLPSQFLGQQSPTRLMLGHSSALLPSSRSQEIRPSPSETGRKLSPVGHCCSRGAKLGRDADLLLMLFETLESISKAKP